MCIDTNTSKNWNPLPVLAVLVVWLVVLTTLAFAASSCGGNSPPPPPTSGSVTLTWSITDLNHRPATCGQVSARSVALRLRNRASGVVTATVFPCEASPGTARVPVGTYDAAFALTAANGSTLATAPPQTGVTVAANQTKRLTPVTFSASTQGGLAITIVAPPNASNCKPPADGGAGITGNTIAIQGLDRGHEGCLPTSFVRRIGARQVGTYVANDCSSPPIASCIERTETLSASVPAGNYLIHLVGKVATRDCWKADATVTVLVGKPSPMTIQLVRQPGC
jgi:hypothetical protein